MSNCYINLCGGLGNQLFQVAAGYSYSRKTNKNFYINSSKWNGGQGRNGYFYRDSIFKNFNYGTPVTGTIYQESTYHYTPIPDTCDDISLNGYFQSLKYFEDHQEEFKDLLTLPEVNLPTSSVPSVAFHIRRGDYLHYLDIHYVCDTKYFERCFEYFEGYQVNVFTDSPEYVKNEFKHKEFNLIEGNSELEDLTLLSLHDNVVCSNSTFSWWGSFLGKQKRKIIVPRKWFNNKGDGDVYRKEMVRL